MADKANKIKLESPIHGTFTTTSEAMRDALQRVSITGFLETSHLRLLVRECSEEMDTDDLGWYDALVILGCCWFPESAE